MAASAGPRKARYRTCSVAGPAQVQRAGGSGAVPWRRTRRREGSWPNRQPWGAGCRRALTPPSGAPIVSLAMRRVLVGLTAIAVALGWLQLAPAFGFPVTAPAAMLDRMLGPNHEASLAGWVILLAGELALTAGYFILVEGRTRGPVAPVVYALAAWLVTGAVLMPLIGVIQGAPPAGDAANDPMRANFFMLNLGAGAAAESLIAWLLFGVVLAAGRTLELGRRALLLAVAGSAATGVIAYSVPALVAQTQANGVVEGRVSALPAGSVFISVLELPQPPGAVLGPHKNIAGFTLDVWGTATMQVAGRGVVDARQGDAVFLPNMQSHDHENRAAVPLAIGLAVLLIGLTRAPG